MRGRITKGFLPGWLTSYDTAGLRPDVIAGLTTAAVVLPKAIAYAAIAGLPPQVGLYTVLIPMAVYAVLGTSRPLSVSTTTTIAILSAAQLAELTPDGDPARLASVAATLAVLVGAMLLAARLLRLGFLANFISEPVLAGFKAGIGVVIVVDQIPKLLGVHIDKAGFLHNVVEILRHVPALSIPTALVAGAMLLVIGMTERFVPRAPAPLVAVALGIAASALLGLGASGVATVGSFPSDLPAFHLPDLTLVEALWVGALGIALMSFTESIAAARAFSAADEPPLNPNRELVAVGLANVAGGLFGAMPAGGGTSQTAVNQRAGARTQIAALATAGLALATLLFLAPVIGLMPQATLAAVVVVTSLPLIDLAEFRRIRRVRTLEFRWAIAAFAGVVLLGTLKGILVAMIVSLVGLASQAQHPPVYALGRKRGTNVLRPLSGEHPDDETFPGLLILRVVGRIYFANAQTVIDTLRPIVLEARPKVVVLDASGILDLEYSALKVLAEIEEKLRAAGITLWIAALNPEPRSVVERSRLGEQLGRDRMFLNVEQAIDTYLEHPVSVPPTSRSAA